MAASDKASTGPHLLVVLAHREAKDYHTEIRGAAPERISPYDPQGHGRHLHSAHEWTDGNRQQEHKSNYEAIAKILQGAEYILLFGSGTGRSSAMDQLLADLKIHHMDLATKVIGSETVDASGIPHGKRTVS